MAGYRRSLVRQSIHYFARPHEGVARAPVGSASAFVAEELRLRDDWCVELSADERDEIVAAVDHARASGKATGEMTRDDLPLPTLSRRIAVFRHELSHGRGVVVLRGVPVERLSQEGAERFFWGLGLHLGVPGAQNPQGDLLGHVIDQGHDDQTEVRAYRTRTEISFHCDAADVVGLLCLKQAPSGGVSRLASSVAVHDEVLRRRPDLQPLLYEPFYLDTKGEGGVRYFAIEPCRFAAGQLRTFYHADYFRSYERHDDAPRLSVAKRQLLDLYDEIASSPAYCHEMSLRPGDVQLLSNHTVVHGRGAYRDSAEPGEKRHLLRLWLSLPDRDGGGGAVAPTLHLLGQLGRARAGELLRRVRLG